MNTIPLISLLILAFIGIPVGLGLLIYFIPKKLGYPRVAKYLALIYGLIVAMIVLGTVFEDSFLQKMMPKSWLKNKK